MSSKIHKRRRGLRSSQKKFRGPGEWWKGRRIYTGDIFYLDRSKYV